MTRGRSRRRAIRKWIGSMLVAALIAGLFVAATGCARRTVVVVDSEGDVTYVQSAPPSPRVETRPPRPTRGAVWVSGHWKWNGHKHVWAAGHWNRKPGGGSWIAGHWAKKPRGWVWAPGHWR